MGMPMDIVAVNNVCSCSSPVGRHDRDADTQMETARATEKGEEG